MYRQRWRQTAPLSRNLQSTASCPVSASHLWRWPCSFSPSRHCSRVCYIAETNVAYLRRTLKLPGMIFALKVGLMASVFYGAVRTANLAWGLGDIGVGLMAWLNIIAILIIFFVARPAITALRDYETQRKAGVEKFVFDPEAHGIKNADFWVKRLQRERSNENTKTK
ncbi:MAG: alanine:cation symporter family protein [Woeseiaceae bacterium]|nr:alanine:cation symporter family protein [Woeseiaceae bacterium]